MLTQLCTPRLERTNLSPLLRSLPRCHCPQPAIWKPTWASGHLGCTAPWSQAHRFAQTHVDPDRWTPLLTHTHHVWLSTCTAADTGSSTQTQSCVGHTPRQRPTRTREDRQPCMGMTDCAWAQTQSHRHAWRVTGGLLVHTLYIHTEHAHMLPDTPTYTVTLFGGPSCLFGTFLPREAPMWPRG